MPTEPEPDVARGHGPAEHAAEELFRARAARFLRRRLDPEAATGHGALGGPKSGHTVGQAAPPKWGREEPGKLV